jgi:hypothetical protein
MSGSSDAQQVVLDFYTGEAAGKQPKIALGGLKLASFRQARDTLVKQGKLVKTPEGRYRPAVPVTTATNTTAVKVSADVQPDPPEAA